MRTFAEPRAHIHELARLSRPFTDGYHTLNSHLKRGMELAPSCQWSGVYNGSLELSRYSFPTSVLAATTRLSELKDGQCAEWTLELAS